MLGPMATNRSYNDMCGLAHALDLIGERWALLIVRELVLGPRRYTDLRAELPGISSNVLAHRLEELATSGILTRRTLPPPAGSAVYELTAWGAELDPILTRLGRWGARSPGHPNGDHLSAGSLIMSLRTNFDPLAATDTQVHLWLRMRGELFQVLVAGGELTAERVTPDEGADPEATVAADPLTLAGLLYGEAKLSEEIDTGALRVHGDVQALHRMLPLFPLPETAAV